MSEPFHEPQSGLNFETSEFQRAMPAFETLIKKLDEDIVKGTWNIVIADEYSGKIPAYVIYFVINKVREKNGLPGAKLLHVDPKDDLSIRKSEKFLKPGQKILIVTEYLSTASGLSGYNEQLIKTGSETTIASLKTSHPEDYYEQNNLKGSRVFSGGQDLSSTFYANPGASLIEEDDFGIPFFTKDPDLIRKGKAIRRDAKKAADFLYDVYFSNPSTLRTSE